MAATLDDLLAQYNAKKAEASSLAASAGDIGGKILSAGSGITGLVGAVTAPLAAQYIGDALGLNKRSAAEEKALGRIRDVAEGGRTAAQSALEYNRARVAQQAAQAASMGPARERSVRQLVGQEQRIGAETQLTGRIAEMKSAEQARAQQAMADIETRAGEAERQRQRQLIAGSVTGGLGALAQSYGGYVANEQRAKDLAAQASGAEAAIQSINQAKAGVQPATPVQNMTAPLTEAGKAQQAQQAVDLSKMTTVTSGDPMIQPAGTLALESKYQAAPAPDFQLSSSLKTPYSRSPFFNEAGFGPGQLQLKQRKSKRSI